MSDRITHLDRAQFETLADVARESIDEALGGPRMSLPDAPWCRAPAATFVTLRWGDRDDALQGCIGTLEPHRSIVEDVASNAVAAAIHDPRARPLAREEIDRLGVEISLLGPPEPIAYDGTEEGAIASLRPDVDGVILRWGRHRGLFLAQVWHDLPDPRDFLAHLKMKAHLPPSFWADGIELHRFAQTKHASPPRAHTSSIDRRMTVGDP